MITDKMIEAAADSLDSSLGIITRTADVKAALEAAEQERWLPIGELPPKLKDGRRFIGYYYSTRGEHKVSVYYWCQHQDYIRDSETGFRSTPTDFQYITPPKE